METITPAEVKQFLDHGESIELIDVRTPAEFREVHVRGARNVPLDRIDASQFAGRGDAPLYVICHKGSRGVMACRKLADGGLETVINVEGGTAACIEAGLPVVRGKATMSLERQVRIAAGSLVLLGVGLSFVNSWFIALSGFVGAGLVFAGITDTCGMGMLLARMPWNQVSSTTCATDGGTRSQPTASAT